MNFSWQIFKKMLKNKISCESVRWELSCSMCMDREARKVTQCRHSLAAMNCDVKIMYMGAGGGSVIVTAFVVHHKETL
jgi:hypothetical protein